MVYLLILFCAVVFVGTIVKCALNDFRAVFGRGNDSIPPPDEKADIGDLNGIRRDLEFQLARLDNLEQLQRLIETQYQTENSYKAQTRLLSRMITLDKQIHATQKLIKALENELS